MVSSDRDNDIAFIAMANGAKHEDQLKAAFCAEYVIISGRFPSTEEEQVFMNCLKSKGWKTNQHRLAFDQWTFTSKQ
ncbi:unnamed protein product [Anisakis simplex]|uniref:DUF3341 domain-containing protein n=1 Tax=Anisakis simplex TaxID=6269 RepID=A0A0M3J5Q8_ANISI|nr:unnamed protein product [Anisakis simplex]